MGWAVGFDSHWQRDIGYGIPAICDHPDCTVEIDRGLSYVCGGGANHKAFDPSWAEWRKEQEAIANA